MEDGTRRTGIGLDTRDQGTIPSAEGERARAVDDSGQNAMDRNTGAVTSFDQGTSDADVDITRRIRQSVTAAEGLSVNGRNVKIITRDGVVVLRGPVESADERRRIVEMARASQGAVRVEDQLAVRGQQ